MATEVLLMADIPDLGSEGDVVTVADGYARNLLFPRKLGAPVSAAARKRLAKMRREREARRQEELERAGEMAKRLENVSCTIPVKTGEDEKLYGSVTAADVSAMLKEQGIDIDKRDLVIDKPIKELGVFNVKVKLHPDVEAGVKVWVVEE